MPVTQILNKEFFWLMAHIHTTFLLCLVLGLPQICTAVQQHGNATDRLALLAFKLLITEDPFGSTRSWNQSVHFCQWHGVTCGRRHQRVISLDLGDQNLTGTISPYTGNMSFLRRLYLHNNSFSGQIPPQLGRLNRLEDLRLQYNSIEGEIPGNISGCSNLLLFDAARNKLEGKIPVELGSLSKLQGFDFGYNNLRGTIPSSFGNLSSLLQLFAPYNSLVGSIPNSLGQLRKLEKIELTENRLSGTIPRSIFNITSIKIFNVQINQIQGTLPSDLGITLPHLEFFSMSSNQITGSIPVSLSNMSNLENILLANNKLTGQVPNLGNCYNLFRIYVPNNQLGSGEANDLSFISSLANATNLAMLALQENNFGGFLPQSIVNLSTNLAMLSLDTNQISGSIPNGIGNLVNLEELYLWSNQLTGRIPPDIGNLRKLQILSLGSNKLSGNIPSSVGNLTLLTQLGLQGNNLHGSIPSSFENCQKLILLDLSLNSLNGTIPPQVFRIPSLSLLLDFSSNQLIGSLPIEIGNLKNLEQFSVSSNLLSGEIPTTLGSCQTLEHLNMQGNSFQGTIPSFFSNLRGIKFLDLSHNNLSGKIPEFLGRFDLKYFNISFNDLEGPVPTNGVFANASAISLNGNAKLCGGILDLQLPRCSFKQSKNVILTSTIKLIISLVSGLLGLSIVLGFLFLCWFKKTEKEHFSDLAGESLFKLSYHSLLRSTNGFSTANLIGVGSFGSVYKGILDQDGSIIAVKVLNLLHHGACKSFIAECEALRNIKHRNLVKVLTACSGIDYQGNDFKALVYEYMENGNLEEYLHTFQREDLAHLESKKLNFLQRLNIAIDVSCALEYLHHGNPTSIVHCDIKPSNVLLDKELVGHIGDFGLARFLHLDTQNSATNPSSTGIRGSIGYTAPEYGMGFALSTSGDVYSFGILLLEMFTGKRPTHDMFIDGLNLHNYVAAALPDRVSDVVDPILLEETKEEEESTSNTRNTGFKRGHKMECLISLLRVGVACSEQSTGERMSISAAAVELHSIKDAFLRT